MKPGERRFDVRGQQRPPRGGGDEPLATGDCIRYRSRPVKQARAEGIDPARVLYGVARRFEVLESPLDCPLRIAEATSEQLCVRRTPPRVGQSTVVAQLLEDRDRLV